MPSNIVVNFVLFSNIHEGKIIEIRVILDDGEF